MCRPQLNAGVVTVRVIAGEAKGCPLQAPRGLATRPTSDKVKGAIFSMVESALMAATEPGVDVWRGRRIIDLYAGSGALGIEALSRGAEWADFVESRLPACRTIRENLARTKLTARAAVHCTAVRRAIGEPYRERLSGPYDVVVMDPPYADPVVPGLLEDLSRPWFLKRGGYIIVEHSSRVSLLERYGDVTLIKTRRHGDTCISMYGNEPGSRET